MADNPMTKYRLAKQAKQDALAICFLALVVVGVFWHWLFQGKALYWGDIGLYFLPMAFFAHASLARGIFPLWNPHLLCGEPYMGDPQVWMLYPSTLLTAFLAPAVALTVTCAIHILLAGVFFYLFLARSSLSCAVWAALSGAAAYMLGGYLASKAQFPNMLQAMAYVPLVLLLADRLVARPRFTRAAGLGAAVGLQLLAAHAQVSLLTIYLAALFGFWRWLETGPARLPFRQLLGWGVVAGLVAAGLSCGQWLPIAELLAHASRQNLSLGAANRFYLPPYEWTNFFWPFRFGDPMHGDWRARGNMWEVACFVGAAPLVLAAYALLAAGRRNAALRARDDVVFWLVIFLLSLWLSMGRIGGLYILAYYLVPGVKAFHDPARMLLGAAVAIPVLAAIGLDALLGRPPAGERRTAAGVALFALTLLPLVWYDRDLHPVKSVTAIQAMAWSPVPRALATDPVLADRQGRVFMADPYKTWAHFTSYKRYAEDDPDYLPHWADTVTPNLAMLSGLDQAGGYEPEALKSSRRAASQAESWAAPADDRRYQASRRGQLTGLLGEMSVRDIVVYRVRREERPDLRLIGESDWEQDGNRVWVYRDQRFLPRARSYPRWTARGQGVVPLGSASPLGLTELGPDGIAITAPASRRAEFVVLADTLHPGWQASIDGRPTPILTVDGLFRGVIVPPGGSARRVVFVYRPETFALGLYLTLLTTGLLCGTLSGPLARRAWQTRTK